MKDERVNKSAIKGDGSERTKTSSLAPPCMPKFHRDPREDEAGEMTWT
jgi:hypothetical protein